MPKPRQVKATGKDAGRVIGQTGVDSHSCGGVHESPDGRALQGPTCHHGAMDREMHIEAS